MLAMPLQAAMPLLALALLFKLIALLLQLQPDKNKARREKPIMRTICTNITYKYMES